MAFRLHRNVGTEVPPYLLVLQHPFLDDELESRVVAPVVPATERQAIPQLNPPVVVDTRPYVAMISGLVAVPKRYLGEAVAYDGLGEDDVKRCLDRLLYGI